jgi:RNA polymerase sigma factor (sigma-70 family)
MMSVVSASTRVPSASRLGSRRRQAPSVAIASDIPDVSRVDHNRVIDTLRAGRLLATKFEYVAHPSFGDPDAEATILAPTPTANVPSTPHRNAAEPWSLPYVSSLFYEPPILTREQEFHLFRKMNYLKYRARCLRDRIDPTAARTAELNELERLWNEAAAIKTHIVRANLRLVVALAKRRFDPRDDLLEQISDGNYALMRAVEKFDCSRGTKFSTYAAWAIRNAIARAYQDESRREPQAVHGCDEILKGVADHRTEDTDQRHLRQQREEGLWRLLARLEERERRVIVKRHGIGGSHGQTLREIGNDLGVTKERVRQIEARAVGKLREFARAEAEWGAEYE